MFPQFVQVLAVYPSLPHVAATVFVPFELCPNGAILAVSVLPHLVHFLCFDPPIVQVGSLVVDHALQLCPGTASTVLLTIVPHLVQVLAVYPSVSQVGGTVFEPSELWPKAATFSEAVLPHVEQVCFLVPPSVQFAALTSIHDPQLCPSAGIVVL